MNIGMQFIYEDVLIYECEISYKPLLIETKEASWSVCAASIYSYEPLKDGSWRYFAVRII